MFIAFGLSRASVIALKYLLYDRFYMLVFRTFRQNYYGAAVWMQAVRYEGTLTQGQFGRKPINIHTYKELIVLFIHVWLLLEK